MGTTAKKLAITYDIDLDFKILDILLSEKDSKITMSNLRNYIGIHASRLMEHIDTLVKWNMIIDKKPERNGTARIISFAKPYNFCLYDLIKIKDSIDTVNEYFSK